ncbi:hypothetical protein GW17_00021027 [Ensete ventricosum]|nr:hypothetical protein GW17_00021027 [Ensete ventricosum]
MADMTQIRSTCHNCSKRNAHHATSTTDDVEVYDASIFASASFRFPSGSPVVDAYAKAMYASTRFHPPPSSKCALTHESTLTRRAHHKPPTAFLHVNPKPKRRGPPGPPVRLLRRL